jgi:hypothetical protein
MVCPLQATHDSFPEQASDAHDDPWQDRRPNEPKEVALMNNTKLWMTAQIPSGFGMPVSGHAFDVNTCARVVDVQGTTVSAARIDRDRVAVNTGIKGAVKGDMGLAYFPGTTAWRPPNC